MTETRRRVIVLTTKVDGAPVLKRTEQQLTIIKKAAREAQGALKGAGTQAQKSTRGIANMGHVVSNVGFQFQDLAVQIQGGVDPMKAMSQQIPQMLIGFGAMGSAIGVVIALMPTLAVAFREFTDQADSFDNSMEAVNSALQGFETDELSESLSATDQALANILERFDRAAREKTMDQVSRSLEAVSESFDSLRERQAQAASAIASPGGGFVAIASMIDSWWNGDVAEGIGLTAEEFEQLQSVFDLYTESGPGNVEATLLLADAITTLQERSETLRPELKELLEDLLKLQELAKDPPKLPSQDVVDRVQENDFQQSQNEFLDEQYRREQLAIIEETKQAEKAAREELAAIRRKEFEERQKQLEEEARIRKEIATVEGDEISFYRGQQESMEAAKSTKEMIDNLTLAEEAMSIFGSTAESAFDGVARGTQTVEQAFKNMVQSILLQLGKLAASNLVSNLFGGAGFSFATPTAKGAVMDGGVKTFATGGIVSRPTLFPMAKGTGLMGEAGPEAIMPLGRNSKGELGIKGGGVNVVVNNNAAGVEVRTRQGEEGLTLDIVMKAVANNISEGGNSISQALEGTYAMGRGNGVY